MSDLDKALRNKLEWRADQKYDDGVYQFALDRIEALELALRQIYEWGPMSVDDQRWRVARDAISEPQKPSHPVASSPSV